MIQSLDQAAQAGLLGHNGKVIRRKRHEQSHHRLCCYKYLGNWWLRMGGNLCFHDLFEILPNHWVWLIAGSDFSSCYFVLCEGHERRGLLARKALRSVVYLILVKVNGHASRTDP